LSYYFILHRSRYSFQHPVHRHLQSLFVPHCQICFNFYVFRQQTKRERVLNRAMVSITLNSIRS
jgi:hypothetical protein